MAATLGRPLTERVDEITSSLIALDADRLEEILARMEHEPPQPPSPSEHPEARRRLATLHAVLAESERNLLILRRLHERALKRALEARR